MHISVLLNEVIDALSIVSGGQYLDATFGAGGYSRRILECSGNVLGIDRDPSVLQFADKLRQEYPGRFEFKTIDFGSLGELEERDFQGIVFDLGVSSMQLDQVHRGFSFQNDAPLDMRMDSKQQLTAGNVVNTMPEEQLADIIYNLGGEKKSRAIARHIVHARTLKPIHTTLELANIVLHAVGGRYNDKIHPATRTFQAIRMYVNDELNQLRAGLEAASQKLAIGGVLCVVAFHSGEDEIVKAFFKQLCGVRKHVNKYAKDQTNTNAFEYVAKLHPSREETRSNPRARSAILRAIRRLV